MQKMQTQKLQPIELSPISDNPLVSILVPNYNYSAYIGKTLDSVLCQTYPHFEIVVCDDGSTDNSCEVVETYIQKDSRINLVRQENKRVAAAFNTAYRQSKGQIICLLDADDLWMPNKLEKVVKAFKSNQKCGCVVHNLNQIDAHGKVIKSSPHVKRLVSGWMGEYALDNGGFVSNFPPTSALSFRREVTDLIFPLNEAIVRNTDRLMYSLAVLITVIESVPEVLFQLRIHGTNITSASAVRVESMAKIIEKLHDMTKLIHQEQKKFLKNIYGTGIAEKLTPQEFDISYCYESYLLARLKAALPSERSQLYQRLVNHPNFNNSFPWSNSSRWILQWYLPDILFMMLLKQIYEASFLKLVLKSLLWEKLIARFVRR